MSSSAPLRRSEKPAGRNPRERRTDHVRSRVQTDGVSLRVDHFPHALMSRRDDLLTLLATRSAKRGTFTLASGRQSSLYIDARITTMSPDGLALIGPLGAGSDSRGGWSAGRGWRAHAGRRSDRLRDQLRERVDAARPLRAFTVRKEPKTHGTGKLIEGPFRAGDRVVVIEDTITTGGSARKAIEAVRAAGGVVVGVLALVDREEGGREALEADGVPGGVARARERDRSADSGVELTADGWRASLDDVFAR